MKYLAKFPGYAVTPDGRVWSDKSNRWMCLAINDRNSSSTYYRVSLRVAGAYKKAYVHELVALAYIGDRPEGYQINHKDGDKHNNHRSNLEYVTAYDNIRHAHQTGLMPNPARKRPVEPTGNPKGRPVDYVHNTAKLTIDQVKEICELLKAGQMSQYAIALRYGVTRTAIAPIAQNLAWRDISRLFWADNDKPKGSTFRMDSPERYAIEAELAAATSKRPGYKRIADKYGVSVRTVTHIQSSRL